MTEQMQENPGSAKQLDSRIGMPGEEIETVAGEIIIAPGPQLVAGGGAVHMLDFGTGNKKELPSGITKPDRKLDILEIQEIVVVEKTGFFQGLGS